MNVRIICISQLLVLLHSQYVIQDVHFDNFQMKSKFEISLNKWKSMAPILDQQPPLFLQCQSSLLYLVIIAETSNQLQWTTPTPTIVPTLTLQAFYSFSIEADFLLLFPQGTQPQAQLIMHLNDTQRIIFDNTNNWNLSYDNGLGNLCQGPGSSYFSLAFSEVFPFNSPVVIRLESIGTDMDGVLAMFSIKNLIIRYAYCDQSCSACTGPMMNQCTACSSGSVLHNGECLCIDIKTCICPNNWCVYVYDAYKLKLTDGQTYNGYGFQEFQRIGFTQVTFSENECLQFTEDKAYLFPLSDILEKQTYMFVVTYKIIIIHPELGFQLQFQYGMLNQKPILSYSNSNYIFSNIDQYTLTKNIEANTDQIEISLYFGIQLTNQNLQLQGTFVSSNTAWLICSVTVREIGCQANCEHCFSQNLCQVCSAGFKLYNGTCLTSCPAGYSQIYNPCLLDLTGFAILPYYSFISFMFFGYETTSDQAAMAFRIISGLPLYSAVHSVMSNDASHARRVFGGILAFTEIGFSQSFIVSKPNYGAIIQYNFYEIDKYQNQIDGYLQFDSFTFSLQTIPKTLQSTSNIIGQLDDDSVIQYQYTYPDPIQSGISLEINCDPGIVVSLGDSAFCAISDFVIILLECQDLCNKCSDAYSCDPQLQTQTCGDYQQLSEDRLTCIDIPMVGCKVMANSICSSCDTNFQIINFQCDCISGYYLNGKQCQSCDVSCLSCNGPLASDCTTCQDSYLLIQHVCQKCQPGCATCLCFTCSVGQQLIENNCFQSIHLISTDILMFQSAILGFYNLNNIITINFAVNHEFCGNNLIEGSEQCDDGNLLAFDGCDMFCRFECHQACLACVNGKCIECKQGWLVDNGSCNVIYNDGFVVPGYEECDDGNTILYDGCNNGLNQCDKYCQTCQSGQCQNCQPGAQLSSKYICQPICGDGVVFGGEQCDDGNQVQYDGCYNCLYQCQIQCLDCQLGICQTCFSGYLYNHHCYDCILPCLTCNRLQCLTCQSGWYPLNNQCSTKCGDGIVTGLEECDSSTNCINCIYVLPANCLSMVLGICKVCNEGYYLNSIQHCVGICGDGMIQSGEQCDDGNLRNYDGCSSECQTESAQSYEAPYMKLKQLTSNLPNVQLVQIQFSQQLQYSTNVNQEQLFNISVLNTSTSIYNIQISELNGYFTYELNITFYETLTQPVLFVQLLYDLTNMNNISLKENSQILIMKSQYYYSQKQLQSLKASSDSMKYLIYMILVLCVITYVLGRQEVFYNFLDILQRCSYLQYMNIGFPYSLQYFFKVFDNVSLNYIFDMFGISIDSISFPQYQSFGKFIDNYNALLLVNTFSTILFLLFISIVYIIGMSMYSTILYGLSETLLQKDLQIPKIKIYCIQSLWATIRQIKMINFREILNSSCYDNTISVLLQLNAIYFNNDIYNILSLNLMVIIILYLYLEINRIWNSLSQIFQKHQTNKMRANITNIWACQYQAIFYLKKIAFCINLVCVQSNQSIQINFIIILTLTNLVLLCLLKPFQSKQELYKLIIEELIILLIYISFFCFVDDLSPFTIEQQNQIAWLDISLFLTCMVVLLLMDIYNLIFIQFYESLKQFVSQINQLIQPLQGTSQTVNHS